MSLMMTIISIIETRGLSGERSAPIILRAALSEHRQQTSTFLAMREVKATMQAVCGSNFPDT